MQLQPNDELIAHFRVFADPSQEARYFEDERFCERLMPPAKLGGAAKLRDGRNDWIGLPLATLPDQELCTTSGRGKVDSLLVDPANGGIRREPELPNMKKRHLNLRRRSRIRILG